MASTLSKQTHKINIIRIQSHTKRKKIPPQIWKRIQSQKKRCEKAFNHTTVLSDWKSEAKLKRNLIDDEYEIDEKSVIEASNLNALIVGSENYNQQYPQIAYQNLSNIFSTIHRRMPRKQWDIPQPILTQLGLNIFTPASFNDQLNINKTKQSQKPKKDKKNAKTDRLPFILTQTDPSDALFNLKDGSDKSNMPYFTNNPNTVEVMIYRDIKGNIKSRNRIQKVINSFSPDSIILQCNAQNFRQFRAEKFESSTYFMKNIINSTFGCVMPTIGNMNMKFGRMNNGMISSVVDLLMSNNNTDINVIAGNICEDYYALIKRYSFLCDLFSFAAIEISPVLENKILPKKIATKSIKLLRANSGLSSAMRYVIQPYFLPHLHLFGQIMNSYLIHCLYGCVNELNSKRILMIVDDENVFDLVTKLQSNPDGGYYFQYSYNSLFKQVDDEFVTMPSILPTTYIQNSSVKLKEFEWKLLHSMFGLKFVQFLEHEMEMKQALVVK